MRLAPNPKGLIGSYPCSLSDQLCVTARWQAHILPTQSCSCCIYIYAFKSKLVEERVSRRGATCLEKVGVVLLGKFIGLGHHKPADVGESPKIKPEIKAPLCSRHYAYWYFPETKIVLIIPISTPCSTDSRGCGRLPIPYRPTPISYDRKAHTHAHTHSLTQHDIASHRTWCRQPRAPIRSSCARCRRS